MPQWAVKGDPTDGGGGDLHTTVSTIYAEGILVVTHVSDAEPDNGMDGLHNNPRTQEHSPNVFAEGNPAHRIDDSRVCGHHTVVQGNQTVYVNELG